MTFKPFALCTLLIVVPGAYAEPAPRPSPAMAAESSAPSSIEESLQRPISLEVREGTTFREALREWRELAGVNIAMNWNAMQQYGITGDVTQVAIVPELRNVTLATALQLLLDQVSSSLGGVTRLGWIVEDNIVYISTSEDLQEHLNEISTQRKARTTEVQINLVDKMKDTYFDPAAAGVVAIGAIKAELQRSGKNVTDELERLLDGTRSLGLRNALHMTLRDLYQLAGNQAKVMEHLTQMLAENDAASMAVMRSGPSDRPGLSRGSIFPPSRPEDPRGGRGEDLRGGGDRGNMGGESDPAHRGMGGEDLRGGGRGGAGAGVR